MKNLTHAHPCTVGIAEPTVILSDLQNSPLSENVTTIHFSPYHKPFTVIKKTPKNTSAKKPLLKNITREKDFAEVNQSQQLLLMQALWLGKNKTAIMQELFNKDIEFIPFVHWLAIPLLGVVLSFSHQQCEKVAWL